MNYEQDVDRLFDNDDRLYDDVKAYHEFLDQGVDVVESMIAADSDLIENYLFKDFEHWFGVEDNWNWEAGVQAVCDLVKENEALRPEEGRMKTIFGIPPMESFKQVLETELRQAKYKALKKVWLFNQEERRKLQSK